MTPGERRIAMSLVSIIMVRMLGLFMILPVFADYARELNGYTVMLAGLAIGIYGLTQGIFQIPMGMLSDRVGRKPVIIAGLLVFAVGSVLAAVSESIYGIIAGRALQGVGAIASAVMALAADLTREEQRMKVMALIGMSFGASFVLALIIGPLLHGWFGLSGIFWLTAALALLAVLIVLFRVPTPVMSSSDRDTRVELGWFRKVVSEPQLLRLDIGVLILHMIMTATFMAVPLILKSQLGLETASHWRVYLPVLLLSIVMILPFILLAERKRLMKQVLVGSVIGLSLACFGLFHWHQSLIGMVTMLVLFFAAFNLLEASLPSLVAKSAPAAHKGAAMGAFSSSQFLGAFLGGVCGAVLIQNFGLEGVFLGNALLAVVWLLVAVTMAQPSYLSSYTLQLGSVDEQSAHELVMKLTAVQGVSEAVVIPEDGVAYLKVDKRELDQEALIAFSAS